MKNPEKPGDTRERHIKYASALRKRYQNAHISIILRVPPSGPSKPVKLAESLTIYPVPCRRWAFAIRARTVLKELLKTQRFDAVTTQTPFDDGWLGVWLKRKFGIPLNVQMRSSFLDLPYWIQERPVVYRIFNMLGKRVSGRADTIRVVSHGEKRRLEKRFRKLRGRVFALHPLVNLQIFEKPLNKAEKKQANTLLQKHELADRPIFLFVGRLVPEKNLPTLLRAFALVRKKEPRAVLVIAGNGPLRTQLERLAKKLRLSPNIIWLGNVPLTALRSWYALARATVLPSFYEGFGKIIVESYLMRTPVVVTPFVSSQELIEDGKTGFITKSFEDQRDLAKKMMLLLHSPKLATDMGDRGKRLVERYLLPEDVYMEHLVGIWRKTADMKSGK